MTQEARPPDTLRQGRYELLDELGSGGMALVFRALDHSLGVQRALKVLRPEAAKNRSIRSRFLAEAKTMAGLDHPHVLRVLDVGEEDGWFFFTMELVTGGSVMDRIAAHGRIEPIEALRIAFDVLQALAAAHLVGVVHRDVKPANILLSADGTVLLADFGIARVDRADIEHRTRTGVTMGTHGYMAPEQRRDTKNAGPAADLFAVGATLYAMCAGSHPPDLFAADLDPALLDVLPPPIARLVRLGTAYRPEDRPPSARAFAKEVARARDELAPGQPSVRAEWLAAFDRLIEARATHLEPSGARVGGRDTFSMDTGFDGDPERATARDPTPAGTTERVRPPPGAPGPSRRAPLVLAVAAAAAGVLGILVVGTALLAIPLASGGADPEPCVGVWEGSMDGLPLTLDLRATDGALSGTARTRLMGGTVYEGPVGGWCGASGGFEVSDAGDGPDAGTYTATIDGDAATGAFTRPAGGTSPFTLTRRREP